MTALTVIASTFPSRTRSGLTDQATASGARSTRGPRPQSRPFHGARAAAPLGRPVGGLPLALPCPAHAGPLSRGSWRPTGHRTRRHAPSRSQPSGGPRALAPGCRRAKASGLASRPVGAPHWPGAGGGGRAGSGEVLGVVPAHRVRAPSPASHRAWPLRPGPLGRPPVLALPRGPAGQGSRSAHAAEGGPLTPGPEADTADWAGTAAAQGRGSDSGRQIEQHPTRAPPHARPRLRRPYTASRPEAPEVA